MIACLSETKQMETQSQKRRKSDSQGGYSKMSEL